MTHKEPPPPPNRHQANYDEAYRAGVGMAIFNRDGLVLLAERIDNPGAWQMPQGGIEDHEHPEDAVFREMEEEVGTRNAAILHVIEEWIYYDFPPYLCARIFDGKYRGQRQKWIALRFLGQDADISLSAHSDPEFSRWKWVTIEKMLETVPHFKRAAYERVMREFSSYAVRAEED